MEKILQEFRIIETDDGFRIEIKGDKEELRDFVMNLDPRNWMHGPHGGPFPFGPRFRMKFGRGFGPFGMAWCWDDEDDEDGPPRRRKRGHGGHGGHSRRRGHEGHEHHHADEHDEEDLV